MQNDFKKAEIIKHPVLLLHCRMFAPSNARQGVTWGKEEMRSWSENFKIYQGQHKGGTKESLPSEDSAGEKKNLFKEYRSPAFPMCCIRHIYLLLDSMYVIWNKNSTAYEAVLPICTSTLLKYPALSNSNREELLVIFSTVFKASYSKAERESCGSRTEQE